MYKWKGYIGLRVRALVLAISTVSLGSIATAQMGDQSKLLLKDPLFQTAKKGPTGTYTLENGIVVKLREKNGYLLGVTIVAPQAVPVKAVTKDQKDTSKKPDQKKDDKQQSAKKSDQKVALSPDTNHLEEAAYAVGVISGYGQDMAKPLVDYLQQPKIIEQMAQATGVSVKAPPIQIQASSKGNTLSLDLSLAQVNVEFFPKVNTFVAAQQSFGKKVVLRVFSDFQCPYCTKFETETLPKLLANKPKDLQVEFHHLPLESIHSEARGAAEASECASQQGQFQPFKDALFQDKKMEWAKENPNIVFINLATKFKLDVRKFKDCLAERGGKKVVDTSIAAAEKLEIRGTPTVLVNGYKVAQPFELEKLLKLIDFARAVD